jgi:hypothetical protein
MKVFTSNYELRKAIINYFNGSNDSDISNWNTSQITNMSRLFENIQQKTVEPITLNWNTSNVRHMDHMFYKCEQDFILNFQTGNVINMCCMFADATNFNQPLRFDTSKVLCMSCMFAGATCFNQPLFFDTSNVIDIEYVFMDAMNFNQPIYFQLYHYRINTAIFENSPMEGQESKYVLEPKYYSKLLMYYVLNKINHDLLYLCDDVEEYYVCNNENYYYDY